MLNYVYFGSPHFARAVLENLVTQYAPPSLTVTQSAKTTGRGRRLQPTPVAHFSALSKIETLEVENVNAPEVTGRITAATPDVLVVVAFGQILKTAVLSIPRIIGINLHGSLLPKYRGAAPVQRSIANGDTVTGVTIQKIVSRLDAGEILLQQEIIIDRNDTSEDLLNKMVPLGSRLLIRALSQLENRSFTLIPQAENEATYAPKLERADGNIDFSRSAEQIRNQIRATIPWPTCQLALGNTVVRILKSEVLDGCGFSGRLLTDRKSFLHIQCGKGRLCLTEIQPANRKPLSIREFLAGYRGDFPEKITEAAR